MRNRIFLKLLLLFAVVIAVATVVLDFSLEKTLRHFLSDRMQRNLTEKTRMFAQRVEADHYHSLPAIAAEEGGAAGARATIIDSSGKVLADSEADPSTMENHSRRKEFVAALAGSVGMDQRTSHTLSIPFLYVAAPIANGAVRLIVAAVAAQLTARRLQRILAFASQISAGDLSARIAESSPDEIGQVGA